MMNDPRQCFPPGDFDKPAPLPPDEAGRLDALIRTGALDTAPEPTFDDIAALAAHACAAPVALVSLVDSRRQWFKARVGLDLVETPRGHAFCAHALLRPDALMEVPDAAADPRFAASPLVTGQYAIRFYAGAPIVTAQGHALGAVCVMDMRPRRLDAAQRAALQALARQTAQLLEWRRMAFAETDALRSEVERSSERLFQVTAAATQALELQSYVDAAHTYRYVNERFLEYWATGREAVEGLGVAELMGRAAYDALAKPLFDRVFQGETISTETTYDFPGPGLRHMRVDCIPVRDDGDRVVGAVIRSQDVTEEVRMQAQLATANEQLKQRDLARERFIHMISHDVREPLNTICNFAGLLAERQTATDEVDRRLIGFVRQGGLRLRGLLDDLLNYTRLDHESAKVTRKPVDLQAEMAGVLDDLADAVQRERAVLRPAPLPGVRGDASLLRLVLQNFVSNALKYHAPTVPPVVRWGAEREADGWLVWVQDEGIGVAPELQGRLFNTFSRLVTRQQFDGTGLGLAICKRIAELHGGRVSVQSDPGHGSRFALHLPDDLPVTD